MMADYPDSKYILNTRPVEHWIRTRRSQVPIGDQEPFRQWYYGTTDVDAIADIWRRQWAELHRDVLSAVPAERLLVFDIESDPPERLCEFAGLPLSCAANYTQENPSLNAVGRFLYPYVGRPLRYVLAASGRNKAEEGHAGAALTRRARMAVRSDPGMPRPMRFRMKDVSGYGVSGYGVSGCGVSGCGVSGCG